MAAPDLGTNLWVMFERVAARAGDRPFLYRRENGSWRARSWTEVAREARALARCLRAHGVGPGDRVVIVAENRPEWCIADLACLALGAVTAPAYTTWTAEDLAYVLAHCEARAVVVGGGASPQRLARALGRAPAPALVIALEEPPAVPAETRLLDWRSALARGAEETAELGGARAGPEDIACFIYTSGTGGRPKGVMLPHRSILANIEGVWSLLEEVGVGDDAFLSVLPLSHAYEHTVGQFLPIAIGAEIWYADGVERVASDLLEARPTIFTCVPRLLDLMRQRILAAVERRGGIRARLFRAALALGLRRLAQGGRLDPARAAFDALLERLVRAEIRARFGGRLKAMVSGGAPLNPEVGRFFLALGVPLLQGYGQTEAGPVISANRPRRVKIETVGPPLDGVEVRIAEDGEILVRGKLVMKGYFKDPEATAAVLRDGWLYTGDVGTLDEDGYLTITDRKKDIIVLSGGDNVAPQKVEGVLLLEPEIAQAVVFGDARPHLVALVVPSKELLEAAATRRGVPLGSPELARDDELRRAVEAAVARANARLSAIERIRRIEILSEPFTVENGLLTPTLKLRRGRILERHGAVLEQLYGTA
ncbi:MAG: long-chain fatty acid--CoA ligase [Geminicoccaceae bacterium]|nr:long-chain fatty acid--CoA ligase [Geminicoccaceae bacterium]